MRESGRLAKSDRRLGKGLAALIGEETFDESTPHVAEGEVSIDRVQANPFQPRSRFGDDTLEELTESIRQNGLLQPLVVRPVADGYQIVAGERRWRALMRLGWKTAPIVSRDLTDEQMLVLALVENLQRENLSPLEEARGYQQLIDDFQLTQEEVGRHVGRDRSTVANSLRLLSLPDEVRELLAAGRISAGHARAILGLDDPQRRIALARAVAREGLSVRETERRVRAKGSRKRKPSRRAGTTSTARDPVARRAELVLQRSLGTQVRIHQSAGQTGEIRIPFHDHDDLARLLQLLGGDEGAETLSA
jgi:ParB family chromosome partitioning protein